MTCICAHNSTECAGERIFSLILGPDTTGLRGFCLLISHIYLTIGKKIRSNTLSPAHSLWSKPVFLILYCKAPEDRIICAFILDHHFMGFSDRAGQNKPFDLGDLKEIVAGICIEFAHDLVDAE